MKLAFVISLAVAVAACSGGTRESTGLRSLTQLPAPTDNSGADLLRDLGETGCTRTYVGNEHNRNFLDYDGNPLVIDTMITAVKFCVGDKRSDAAGGLSDSPPEPLRFVRNGIAYDEWTVLLSGIGFHGLAAGTKANPYAHYVFGPIDSNGVDQSGTEGHPREGLGWLPLRVAVPASGWNGRLIEYIGGGENPGYDVGFALTQDPGEVPAVDLLGRGWAFCTYQQVGLVRDQQNPWAADGSYWSPGRDVTTMSWCMSRARIDADGNETKIPIKALRNYYDTPGTSDKPDKEGIHVAAQSDATLARNVANLVKNLLEDRLGARPTTTIFGRPWGSVMALNHGRIVEAVDPDREKPAEYVGYPQYDENGLTARSGGNYNVPYDPSSGLVFDGFFVMNGSAGGGRVEADDDIHALVVDPEFPVTAPVIHLSSAWDNTTRTTSSLRWAHALALALQEDSVDASVPTDLNDVMRIYYLQGVNHSVLTAAYASGAADGGTHWYEGGANGIGVNTVGKGRRLSYLFDLIPLAHVPAAVQYEALEPGYNKPRNYPFLARVPILLAAWAEDGEAPPQSHLDAFTMSHASESTWLPNIPLAPSACQQDILDLQCWKSQGPVVEDCLVKTKAGFSTTMPQRMSARTVEAIRYLNSSGALDFTTEPIVFPEDKARLGLFVVQRLSVLLSPFTAAELANGYADPNGKHYAGYAGKDAWVAQVEEAAEDLVDRGLFDEALAEHLVEEAAASTYPR